MSYETRPMNTNGWVGRCWSMLGDAGRWSIVDVHVLYDDISNRNLDGAMRRQDTVLRMYCTLYWCYRGNPVLLYLVLQYWYSVNPVSSRIEIKNTQFTKGSTFQPIHV